MHKSLKTREFITMVNENSYLIDKLVLAPRPVRDKQEKRTILLRVLH